ISSVLLGSQPISKAATDPSAYDVMIASPVHRTLTRLVSTVQPVAELLKSNGPFTFFPPTDAAFVKLNSTDPATFNAVTTDSDLLSRVLQYHVVPGEVIEVERPLYRFYTTAMGGVLNVDITASKKSVAAGLDGSPRIINTAPTNNGVIQILDTVLIPPISATKTATKAILTSFVSNVEKQNLTETVDSLTNVTIFAPNNKAFTDFGSFLSSKGISLTNSMLQYELRLHIVPGILYTTDLLNMTTARNFRTIANDTISIRSTGGKIFINGTGNIDFAQVLLADVVHTGGVLHSTNNLI
ncbi:FAS1 domain-containing protein, partial [Globomyces pollinis-pini]